MVKNFVRPHVLPIALIVLMVTPVLCVAIVPALRPAALMARYWQGQLESIPDDRVVVQLAQIAELDDAASSVLVEALGSRREVLSSAAGSELHRQLDQWSTQPSAESSAKVARLAELLSSRVEQWEVPARSIAADLARRIINWPAYSQRFRRPDVIAHCERILRSMAVAGPSPSSDVAEPDVPDRGSTIAAAQAATHDTDPQGVMNIPLAGETGGGLHIEEVQIPPFPPSLADAVVPSPLVGDEPQLIPPIGKQLPYVMFPENESPLADPVPPMPVSPAPRELAPQLQDDSEATHMPSAAKKRLEFELEHLPDLDLIRRLNDPRTWMATAAESQLENRGFGEAELNLARVVACSDVQKRCQLAASLDRFTKAPSRWLFWLSYDPDPSVRRTVISLMATSQDPRLQRRLRELLTTELDTSVREALMQWNDTTTKRR